MAGTVITIFRWSIFRISSIALLLLWSFNPLGSQATFRGIRLQPGFDTFRGHISYYDPTFADRLKLVPAAPGLYSAALYDYVASTQYVDPMNVNRADVISMLGGESSAGIQAAMDAWGNIRIPEIEHMSSYNPQDPHKWLKVPWHQRISNYSSLLGDRVHGVNRSITGNTTFMIPSSYQSHDVSNTKVDFFFASSPDLNL
jgi:hypothetical protein